MLIIYIKRHLQERALCLSCSSNTPNKLNKACLYLKNTCYKRLNKQLCLKYNSTTILYLLIDCFLYDRDLYTIILTWIITIFQRLQTQISWSIARTNYKCLIYELCAFLVILLVCSRSYKRLQTRSTSLSGLQNLRCCVLQKKSFCAND